MSSSSIKPGLSPFTGSGTGLAVKKKKIRICWTHSHFVSSPFLIGGFLPSVPKNETKQMKQKFLHKPRLGFFLLSRPPRLGDFFSPACPDFEIFDFGFFSFANQKINNEKTNEKTQTLRRRITINKLTINELKDQNGVMGFNKKNSIFEIQRANTNIKNKTQQKQKNTK